MPAIPTFTFAPWNPAYTYAKWDVAAGALAGDPQYYYSTAANNLAANPRSLFVYSPISATRTNNVVRMSFASFDESKIEEPELYGFLKKCKYSQ